MDVPLGTSIGKYQITELVGRGAMASVYRVRHVQLRAEYALKVLEVDQADVCERLVNEGRVQASLNHPNVVGVSDVIRIDRRPALVLEFVDGPDLETFIRKRSPLSLEDIDTIAKGIIKGVRAAHRAGHLHRDLKPSNILMAWLDDTWVPKVADFGLAKVLHGGTESIGATRRGQIMGSPPYMSPEQCRDSSSVDERSDVFSLGAVLYELATGQRAFEGPDIVSIFTRIAAGAYTPPGKARPDLPKRIVEALEGALVVDRKDRIPDCDTLLEVWTGQQRFATRPRDVTASMIGLLGDRSNPADTLYTRSSASLSAVPVTVWGSMASVVAIGAAVGGMLLGGALVGVLVFAFSGMRTRPPSEIPVPVAAPVVEPVVEPEPEPEPEVLPEPEPEPEPVVAPPPAPVSPVSPVAPAPVAPRPAPSAAPAPWTGNFRVEGDASVLLWNAAGTFNHWEPVPAGTYRVNALFHGHTEKTPIRGLSVQIEPARTVLLRCTAATKTCVVVP